MNRMNTLISDQKAANSAIATVLMFAGVMSIISIMLVSIVPVINELQGAIESSDAVSQFEDLSEYECKKFFIVLRVFNLYLVGKISIAFLFG